MVFLVFRQQTTTIQALVQVEAELVSKRMVKFAEGITPESIVLVEGTIQKPLDLVNSCTVQDAEIKIKKVRFANQRQVLTGQIHVISEAPVILPFSMADASRPASNAGEGSTVALDTRLDNRVLDLRVRLTGTSAAADARDRPLRTRPSSAYRRACATCSAST